ncbi:unnamed protein product [Rhizophagus irregularis]|nr:unnamed protein product [Rhizophagus irregularis]
MHIETCGKDCLPLSLSPRKKRKLMLIKYKKRKKKKRLIGLKKTAVLKKTISLIVCVLKDRGPTSRLRVQTKPNPHRQNISPIYNFIFAQN